MAFEPNRLPSDPAGAGVRDLVREHPELVAREIVVRLDEEMEDLEDISHSYGVPERDRFDDDER